MSVAGSRRAPLAAGLLLIAWSLARAQPAPGRHTLGFLDQGRRAQARETAAVLGVLLHSLGRLGYVEGVNLRVEVRFAEGNPERLPALARDLVLAKPNVIAVQSAGIARAVLDHTHTIPVVALGAGELEAEPQVASLRRPGGNLTGMQVHSPELIAKRLQLLTEVVPGLQRVAVLRGVPFDGPGYALYHDANESAAARLGIRARYVQFRSVAELQARFAEMARERDQALLVWGNPHLNLHRREIAELALRHRLPTLYDTRLEGSAVDELLAYSPRLIEVWREGADYVDRIFRGTPPGELPIGQARSFDLLINLRVARALGIAIPRALLLRANEVVE